MKKFQTREINVNTSGLKSLDKIGLDVRVEVVERDQDGIWMFTMKGWCHYEGEKHTFREDTVKGILEEYSMGIIPCTCERCS